MANENVIQATFDGFYKTCTEPSWFIDHGMKLSISGIALPAEFECHFSNSRSVAAKRQIGENGVVAIPDEYFLSNAAQIFCWIYLHPTVDSGVTEYEIVIPLRPRPNVDPAEPTQEQQDIVDQAIAALNVAMAATSADAESASASASAALESEQAAAGSATNAHNSEVAAASSADSALASKNSAEQSALNASASEANAAQSADDAEQSADRAEQAADAAGDSAGVASTKATEAANSATAASNSATTATTKAGEAATSATNAANSANTANTKAGEAAQSSTNAADSATAASGSASDANAAKLAAQAAQTAAETAQGKAEDAQAAAEQAVSSVSGLSGQITQNTADIADLQDIVDKKAGALVDSASGSIVSVYPDKTVPNVYGLTADIDPVQDLHGYDNPWPAGGGKNLLPPLASQTLNGVTLTNNNGVLTLNGTATQDTYFDVNINLPITAGEQVYFGAWNPAVGTSRLTLFLISTAGNPQINLTNVNAANNYVATVDNTITRYRLRCPSGYELNNFVVKPMLQIGGTQPAQFEPYSNICPITGWTGANIHVSPTTDAADGTIYDITFPTEAGTVYGGTLDVTNGVLTVDRAMVDMGTLPLWVFSASANRASTRVYDVFQKTAWGTHIGLCSSYVEGRIGNNSGDSVGFGFYNTELFVRDPRFTSGTTGEDIQALLSGIQLVYELATPITYQLTPQEVSTIAALTNIWADTGDVSVEYAADLKHYIDTKIAAAVAAMS